MARTLIRINDAGRWTAGGSCLRRDTSLQALIRINRCHNSTPWQQAYALRRRQPAGRALIRINADVMRFTPRRRAYVHPKHNGLLLHLLVYCKVSGVEYYYGRT